MVEAPAGFGSSLAPWRGGAAIQVNFARAGGGG